MPRASSAPRHLGSAFRAEEWERITALPAEVMIACTATWAEPPRRTVAAGLAGLDAIAAGRAFDSDLVRAVVAAIFAEPVADHPTHPAAPVRGWPQVLADCRRVAEVLRARADLADANAYRHWVQQIAVRVFAAVGGPGSGWRGEHRTQRAVVDDLAAALA